MYLINITIIFTVLWLNDAYKAFLKWASNKIFEFLRKQIMCVVRVYQIYHFNLFLRQLNISFHTRRHFPNYYLNNKFNFMTKKKLKIICFYLINFQILSIRKFENCSCKFQMLMNLNNKSHIIMFWKLKVMTLSGKQKRVAKS